MLNELEPSGKKNNGIRSESSTEHSFENEIKRLNPEQRKAVDTVEGPVMVIAGPGTGKTQVIAARIGNILSNPDLQADPSNILCLTYTDAGTVAMRQRLLKFIGPTAYKVSIYTFHAFCNMVIQENLERFGTRALKKVSDLEKVKYVRNIIDQLPAKHILKDFNAHNYYVVNNLLSLWSQLKREDWTEEKIRNAVKEYLDDLPDRPEYQYKRANAKRGIEIGDPKTADIDAEKKKMDRLLAATDLLAQYDERMRNEQRYDFDDMINWVLSAFRSDESLLVHYQERFQYMLVDEYQDTNGSQNDILRLLINYWDSPNVFVVGDDDQSIYEFQGARIQNIVELYEAYHSTMEMIVLKQNYRSTQNVIDAASSVINNNQERLTNRLDGVNKELKSGNPSLDQNITPEIIRYANNYEEAAAVIKKIEELRDAGQVLNEIAVIYNQHKQSDLLIDLAERRGIPHHASRKVDLLSIPLIKNVLTIMDCAQLEFGKTGLGDHLVFDILHMEFFKIPHREIARLSYSIGRDRKARWLENCLDDAFLDEHITNSETKEKIKYAIHFLHDLINDIANKSIAQIFEAILNKGKILQWIMLHAEKIWYMQVITSFFNFIKEEHSREPDLDLIQLQSVIEEMTDAGIRIPLEKTIYEETGVQFITAHSAKGLEFKYVFLIGCQKDVWDKNAASRGFSLPDTLTQTKDRTESSRRLFYVAMTRAKTNLQISFAQFDAAGKEKEYSKYVAELVDASELAIKDEHLDPNTMLEYELAALTEKIVPAPEWIEEQYLKNALQDYVMSVTHLNKYIRCPLSFYFENVLRVPMAKSEAAEFGSAIHDTLQKLFGEETVSQSKLPSLEEVLTIFQREMDRRKDAFGPQSFHLKSEQGKQILDEWYTQYSQSWNLNVRTEEDIKQVEVDGVPIRGFLDKIELNAEGLNVVDYKTGKVLKGMTKTKAPTDKNPDGGDYWRQMVFYKLLIDGQKVHPWKMISGEVDFLEKDAKEQFQKVKLVISDDDIQIVKKQIKDAYTGIMNHEFGGRCEEEWCYWCNFTQQHFVMPVEIAMEEE